MALSRGCGAPRFGDCRQLTSQPGPRIPTMSLRATPSCCANPVFGTAFLVACRPWTTTCLVSTGLNLDLSLVSRPSFIDNCKVEVLCCNCQRLLKEVPLLRSGASRGLGWGHPALTYRVLHVLMCSFSAVAHSFQPILNALPAIAS